MDKFSKMFIKASMIYLGLGVLIAVYMALVEGAMDELRFVHVHFMLLGFMAMMIYGVAYHILPRFNAVPLLYPAWVPAHFWLANIGLWGMCILFLFGGYYSSGPLKWLFGIFSGMEGVAIFLFIINILSVLKDEPKEAATLTPMPSSMNGEQEVKGQIKLAPSMKISEILDKYPQLEELLSNAGYGDLVVPEARESIAKMVSLEMAAKKAGKDVNTLIAALEGKQLLTTANTESQRKPESSKAAPEGTPASLQISRGETATIKTLIGPLLEVYPETRVVFEKHYGAACFTCPGQQTETIEQTAGMHGMPPQKILDEINAIIETAI